MEKGKILVVDDEEDLAVSLKAFLESKGYSVTYSTSGTNAIELFKNNDFDIVILDIRMPDMSGIEVLRKIREIERERKTTTCVIMITAYASETAPIKALKLGADDYLMKPFDLNELLRSVEKNMKIITLQREKERYLKELEKANKRYENLLVALTRILYSKTSEQDLKREIENLIKEIKKKCE